MKSEGSRERLAVENTVEGRWRRRNRKEQADSMTYERLPLQICYGKTSLRTSTEELEGTS
jgi:hypothetical protein